MSNGHLQEDKNNVQSLTVRPKKWSWLLGKLEVIVYLSLRGYNCKDLTGKMLVFWIGGRLWEVVTYERWLHMEVRLYVF